MLDSQKCILDLISYTLNGNLIPDSYKLNVPLEQVFKIAAEQDICLILFTTVSNLAVNTEADSSYKKTWKNAVLFSCMSQLGISNDLIKLHESLTKEKIRAVFLKGIVLKLLYPQPELRSMRDIDILVEPKSMQSAINILKEMGYAAKDDKEDEDGGLHLFFTKDMALPVELHYSLIHKKFMGKLNVNPWYEHIWDNLRTVHFDSTDFTVLSHDDEFINLIIHFATHMVYSGSNLKQLYDILIFLEFHKKNMNYDYIFSTLKMLGLFRFSRIMLSACRDILGFDSPIALENQKTELSKAFFEDIFNIKLINEKTSNHECWKDFMLRYTFMRNHPYLSLVSWILETGFQIIHFKKDIIKSVLWSNNTLRFVKKRFKLLKSLGITHNT